MGVVTYDECDERMSVLGVIHRVRQVLVVERS